MTQERPTGPAHGQDRDRTGTGPQATVGQDRGPDLETLSPRQAARIAAVGKSTIMRAIEGLNLPARRDNRNQWRIQRLDLHLWMMDRGPARRTGLRTGPGQDCGPEGDTPAHLEITGLRAMLARLEEERAAEIARLEEKYAAQTARLEGDLASARATAAAQAEATIAAQAETAAARQRIAELEGQAKEAAAWRDALVARLPDPNPPRRRWWPWSG